LPTIFSSVEVIASTGDVDFSIAAGLRRRAEAMSGFLPPIFRIAISLGALCQVLKKYFWFALLRLNGM
jgi:hypothetical protein